MLKEIQFEYIIVSQQFSEKHLTAFTWTRTEEGLAQRAQSSRPQTRQRTFSWNWWMDDDALTRCRLLKRSSNARGGLISLGGYSCRPISIKGYENKWKIGYSEITKFLIWIRWSEITWAFQFSNWKFLPSCLIRIKLNDSSSQEQVSHWSCFWILYWKWYTISKLWGD